MKLINLRYTIDNRTRITTINKFVYLGVNYQLHVRINAELPDTPYTNLRDSTDSRLYETINS